MADDAAKVGGIAVDRLRSLVERIERLSEEKRALSSDIADIFKEARGCGYDVPALRAVIRLRKMGQADVDEMESILDTYRRALGI